jgi:hypothetical protein
MQTDWGGVEFAGSGLIFLVFGITRPWPEKFQALCKAFSGIRFAAAIGLPRPRLMSVGLRRLRPGFLLGGKFPGGNLQFGTVHIPIFRVWGFIEQAGGNSTDSFCGFALFHDLCSHSKGKRKMGIKHYSKF